MQKWVTLTMQLKLSYVDPHNQKVVECVYNAEKHEDISTAYLHAVKIISDKMGKYVHVKLLDDDCGCTSCG